MPRENYHLTTKFLGNIADDRVGDIAAAVAAAAGGMVAFEVRLADLGAFPSARRARVVWIGLDDAAGGFAALASACDDAFAPLGFEPERRPFVPHLTLARLRAPASVDLPDVQHDRPAFVVDRATLYLSHLGRPASRYEPLAVYPFGLGA